MIKFYELLDTVFLVLKKKPLGKHSFTFSYFLATLTVVALPARSFLPLSHPLPSFPLSFPPRLSSLSNSLSLFLTTPRSNLNFLASDFPQPSSSRSNVPLLRPNFSQDLMPLEEMGHHSSGHSVHNRFRCSL